MSIYESLFFVSVITFLLRFLGLLIRDLDNPFGYYEGASVEDVSLKPLEDVLARLQAIEEHVVSAVSGGTLPHRAADRPSRQTMASTTG